MSRIIRLESENVKRIRAVSITPDPDEALVVIRGMNGEGKTSVLDSIAYALGGKRVQPPNLVRAGAVEARVLVETEDLIIERKWTSNTDSTVEVRSKDGEKFKAPQKMLDALVGRLSFDPLAFMMLDAAAQAEALRKVVNLDFGKINGQRLKLYDDRTLANRDLAGVEARLAAAPPAKEVQPIDVGAVLERRRLLEVGAREHAEVEAAVKHAKALETLAAQAVKTAELAMATAYSRKREASEAVWAAEAKLAQTAAVDPMELERLSRAVSEASAQNSEVEKQKERAKVIDQVAAARESVEKLNRAIADIDAEKEAQIKAVSFPVAGLGFSDVGVTLNGQPLEQASGAERLRVSVGIGLALNPGLRVLLVRDGSLLDAKSYALLEKLAEEADGQVFIEVVGDQGVGIVIEDGMVKGQHTLPGDP